LENLSASVADLHEYAAMRLVSVAIMVMKKHAKFNAVTVSSSSKKEQTIQQQTTDAEDEQNSNSPLTMYTEVSHTLLGIIKHGLSARNIEGNLHLVYALVYHQMDLINLFKATHNNGAKKLYSSKQTERIESVVLKASGLIQEEGARSAPKALQVLDSHMVDLKETAIRADHTTTANKSPSKRKYDKDRNMHSTGDDGMGNANSLNSFPGEEEFTFSYEEEADPEVFFVPYVWDLISSVVTASTIEWRKDEIQAFALLDEVEEETNNPSIDYTLTDHYSKNADEMV